MRASATAIGAAGARARYSQAHHNPHVAISQEVLSDQVAAETIASDQGLIVMLLHLPRP